MNISMLDEAVFFKQMSLLQNNQEFTSRKRNKHHPRLYKVYGQTSGYIGILIQEHRIKSILVTLDHCYKDTGLRAQLEPWTRTTSKC